MSPPLERALLLAKPNQTKLINHLTMAGFHTIYSTYTDCNKDEAMEFYELNRKDQPFSALSLLKVNITKNIACKPILAMCVAKLNAVNDLKAMFKDTTKWNKQVFHFTENSADAENELRFFFPKLVKREFRLKTVAGIRKYLDKHVFSVLIRSLVDVAECKDEENVDLYTLVMEVANNDKSRPIVTVAGDSE